MSTATAEPEGISDYLTRSRDQVLRYIHSIVPDSKHTGGLYKLILDYPLREGKSLRPALCLAVCQALNGKETDALPSAAALELYHNAFLVHDDVEDGSLQRRRDATLHRKYGVPIAINVGDATLALAMEPLLGNIETIGLGRALRILEVVQRMARESTEGQMLELQWRRDKAAFPCTRDYVRMVYKKTCWYSFVAPMEIGAIASGASAQVEKQFWRFALVLGVAFQIVDDLLNLTADISEYGKEIGGDLWEGKYTLILIHTLNSASQLESRKALRILTTERPDLESGKAQSIRTEEDVAYLRRLIEKYDGIRFARQVATRYATEALRRLQQIATSVPRTVHLEFLYELVTYVSERRR